MLYNARVSTLLKLLLSMTVAAALVAVTAFLYVRAWQAEPLALDEDRKVVLAAGQSFSAFARQLEADGLLEKAWLWIGLARLNGSARRVQAGEYWVRAGDRPGDLLDRLLAGEVVRYEIALIEGWTLAQALAALASHPELEQELAGVDETTVLGVLGLPSGNGEGLFFPDTYHFERGVSDADILRRAYRKLEEELARAWQSRDSGLPYELNSMGTCVEGEWNEVRDLVDQCFQELQKDSDRVYLALNADYRKGPSGRLKGKVEATADSSVIPYVSKISIPAAWKNSKISTSIGADPVMNTLVRPPKMSRMRAKISQSASRCWSPSQGSSAAPSRRVPH